MRTKRIYHVGGGTGSGNYERTDPDYRDKRIARMRDEYNSLPKEWKGSYLAGLDRSDRDAVLNKESK